MTTFQDDMLTDAIWLKSCAEQLEIAINRKESQEKYMVIKSILSDARERISNLERHANIEMHINGWD